MTFYFENVSSKRVFKDIFYHFCEHVILHIKNIGSKQENKGIKRGIKMKQSRGSLADRNTGDPHEPRLLVLVPFCNLLQLSAITVSDLPPNSRGQ